MEFRRDHLFNHALRTVAFHFTKIGEAIRRYADDSDALLSERTPSSHNTPYDPSADEPARVLRARSNRQKEETPNAPKPKSWDRPTPPSADLPSFPLRDTAPYFSASHRGASPPNFPSYPPADSDDPVDYKSVLRRRKRRASDIPSFEPREGLNDRPADSRGYRPNKRVRINWSEAENKTFFDAIAKFSHLDEASLVKEIVREMRGARTWIQCKGHFRNLVVVGRILYRNTNPKGWVVADDLKGKRASPRSVSLNQGSGSQRGEGDEVEPGKIVEVDVAGPVNTDKGKDAHDGSETGNIATDGRNNQVHSDRDADPDYAVEDDETMAPDMELPTVEVRKPTPTISPMNDPPGGSSAARDGSVALRGEADVGPESDAGTLKDDLPKLRQPINDSTNQVGNAAGEFRARGGLVRRTALRRVSPTAGRGTQHPNDWSLDSHLTRR